jgi:hypothetical protein
MTAGVGHDQRIVLSELLAAGVDPVFVAASAAVKKEKRISGAIDLAVYFNLIDGNGFGFHAANYARACPHKQSSISG